MRKETIVGDVKIVTYGLKQHLHDMVVSMLNDKPKTHHMGGYSLEEPDSDMIDVWIENANEDGDKDYEDFLTEMKEKSFDFYVLNDNLGGYSQPMGEVAMFYVEY